IRSVLLLGTAGLVLGAAGHGQAHAGDRDSFGAGSVAVGGDDLDDGQAPEAAEELALEEGVRGAAHDRDRRCAGLVHGGRTAAAVVRVLGLAAGAEVEPLAADGARQGGPIALGPRPRLVRAGEVRL